MICVDHVWILLNFDFGTSCTRIRKQALRQQQQQNEQADSRLEERWHTTVKEESVAALHFKKKHVHQTKQHKVFSRGCVCQTGLHLDEKKIEPVKFCVTVYATMKTAIFHRFFQNRSQQREEFIRFHKNS